VRLGREFGRPFSDAHADAFSNSNSHADSNSHTNSSSHTDSDACADADPHADAFDHRACAGDSRRRDPDDGGPGLHPG
jgi:hypothetical protein